MEKKIQDEIKALDLRGLRNRGMKVVAQMEDFRNKRSGADQTLTADQEAEWDKWDEECVVIEKEVKFQERKEAFNAEEARGPKGTTVDTTEEKYDSKFAPNQRTINRALKKVAQRGFDKLNVDEKKIVRMLEVEQEAFSELLYAKMDERALSDEHRSALSNLEKRALTTQTTTSGGFTIPQGFVPEVIRSMKYISCFFDEFSPTPNGQQKNIFTVLRTDKGNDTPWPTGDDTSNVGELLAENTTVGSSLDLVFGQKTLKAYKYSTKPILVPYELFEDTGIDLVEYIGDMMGSRIGRIANTHLTTGDNSSKPQGIVTGAAAGKIAATTGALSFPEIIDLIHSVDVAYRKKATCRFMMHDLILAKVKKLTVGAATTNARPLWAPGWNVGAPPTIDGFEYLLNNDMTSVSTTGAKMMLFGDMKAYAVRLVNNFRAYRLEERYRDLDQTGFVGFMRLDGRILNSSAIKYYAGT